MLLVILLVGAVLRVADLNQLPPGLYHDEAFSGLDAISILRGAGLPIFFEGNGGREPFFIYLHALSIFLFGATPFALRLPAAFIGIATIIAFFACVRTLNFERRYATGIALIATAGLAVSYWHLNFSRMGWRTNSLLFFACLAFYFFWRARRTNRARDRILAGAFLGVALYTYLSARFLPIVIALFWLVEFSFGRDFISRRRELVAREHFRGVLLVVFAALVVFAPLGAYFAFHPQALLFRVTDVTLAGGNQVVSIASNAWRVAQMFYASGDVEWRHGIARRPVLDWVVAIPFALGFLWAIWNWRKPESKFVLLWLSVMLLPTILSKDAPDLQRAIGALPAICLFVAWGFAWLVQKLSTRISHRSLVYAATLMVLIGSGAITARDYFSVWANDAHAYYDYHGDLRDLAVWLNAQSQDVVLPLDLYASSTIHFLTLTKFNRVLSTPDVGGEPKLFVAPNDMRTGQMVMLRGDSVILLDPSVKTATGHETKELVDRYGRKIAAISTATISTPVLVSMTPVNADFDHRLNLVGYALSENLASAKSYSVTLYWSFTQLIQQGFKVFVHLLDARGNVVAGVDEPMGKEFHASLLPLAQTIPDEHVLQIPAGIAPGKYSLEIGIYLPANDSRLPIWSNGTRLSDDRLLIPLKVAQSSPSALRNSVDVQFGEALALAGYEMPLTQIKRGDNLQLALLWKCLRPINRDYTIFVHVLDAQSQIIAQSDFQPQNGNYPTSIWDSGENILDQANITIPANAPTGKYSIVIGWYDAASGERLPVQASTQFVLPLTGEIQ
jgi:4-amino-4-deoxy-L-arabinose transferase-like glycosyltransferase